MSKPVGVSASNPKLWAVIGVMAGIGAVVAALRRRRGWKDRGAFVERFEISSSALPASDQLLFGLTFAVTDLFDVKDHVTRLGSSDWKVTQEEVADNNAVVVSSILEKGATCVGKTGMTGDGSAVSVVDNIVDFSVAIDTMGCVRIPAALHGIFGYRPSQGSISRVGVVSICSSLDTVGWFARNPVILHLVGRVLLQLNTKESKRVRRFVYADDLFHLSNVPKRRIDYISKAIEHLSDKAIERMDLGRYIASYVSSLEGYKAQSANLPRGTSVVETLSSLMIMLQRFELKKSHPDWAESLQQTAHENVEVDSLSNVMTVMRDCIGNLLKDDGILVVPTVADTALKLMTNNGYFAEVQARDLMMSSIASLSGCCEVAIPLDKHSESPISVSLLASHNADQLLLDTVLEISSSLQKQFYNMCLSESWNEKGDVSFKRRDWMEAVTCYSKAIELNSTESTYFGNGAAALLELRCYEQAMNYCTIAIRLDEKNVKAYSTRGAVQLRRCNYEEAIKDFKQALVIEPKNEMAKEALEILREQLIYC